MCSLIIVLQCPYLMGNCYTTWHLNKVFLLLFIMHVTTITYIFSLYYFQLLSCFRSIKYCTTIPQITVISDITGEGRVLSPFPTCLGSVSRIPSKSCWVSRWFFVISAFSCKPNTYQSKHRTECELVRYHKDQHTNSRYRFPHISHINKD